MLDDDKEHSAARQAVREMRDRVSRADDATLDLLLRSARTHYGWVEKDVDDESLRALHDLAKWGPTSMNQQPARYVFVRSEAAKQRLAPALMEQNRAKMLSAPVTAIVAYDTRFHDYLPKLFPPNPKARDMFEANDAMREANAFRNGSMQGAYFILAARALGLDAGPMSGFDPAAVDEAFLRGTTWKSNFLCNLGYGDEEKIFVRLPRLEFEQVAQIV